MKMFPQGRQHSLDKQTCWAAALADVVIFPAELVIDDKSRTALSSIAVIIGWSLPLLQVEYAFPFFVYQM